MYSYSPSEEWKHSPASAPYAGWGAPRTADAAAEEAFPLYPSCVDERERRVFLSNWAQAADRAVVVDALRATHVVNCTPDHGCPHGHTRECVAAHLCEEPSSDARPCDAGLSNFSPCLRRGGGPGGAGALGGRI